MIPFNNRKVTHPVIAWLSFWQVLGQPKSAIGAA